jgi:hypothetical protein
MGSKDEIGGGGGRARTRDTEHKERDVTTSHTSGHTRSAQAQALTLWADPAPVRVSDGLQPHSRLRLCPHAGFAVELRVKTAAGVGQSRQRVCAACTGPCRPESRTRTDARSAAEEDRQQRAAFRIAQNGRPRRPTSARAAEPRRVRTDSPKRRRVRLTHPFTETDAELRQNRFA